jgi:hypothetical protein
MPILTKGKTFGGTETVTSSKLHELVDAATFATPATAPLAVSGGRLVLEDGGVSASKLGTAAVTPAKIASTTAEDFVFDRITVGKRATLKKYTATLTQDFTPDMLNGQVHIYTLEANVIIGAPANVANDGASSFLFIIKQDGTGNRTVTWGGPLWRFPRGAAPIQTAAPNSVDMYSIVWDDSVFYVTHLPDYKAIS